MGNFHGFDHLNGDQQRERMKGWGPIPRSVVEPILISHEGDLTPFRFLVCRRLKGGLSVANPPATTTTNPGGGDIVPGKDDTPMDTVIRLINAKLGYRFASDRQANYNRLYPLGMFGPALNKANMKIVGGKVQLIIHDEPLEPENPTITHLFAVNMYSLVPRKLDPGNGSLEELGWLTLEEVVEQFGNSPHYICFQFLFQYLRAISVDFRKEGATHWHHAIYNEALYPEWRPGTYEIPLRNLDLIHWDPSPGGSGGSI